MIEINVSKALGRITISPSIKDEGTICIQGKNGSGKTTTLLMMCGFIIPDSGHIVINNRDVTFLQPQKRSAVFINQDSYFPSMEVEEHLIHFLKGKNSRRRDADTEEIRNIMGINFGGKVKTLSMGQKIRVAVGTALLARPQVIAIDEALSNLDDKNHVLRNMRDYAGRFGIDLIFVTQDEKDSEVSDHTYRMMHGISERLF
ncbi:ATP-binding cassette domain-containing protein [Oxyplasma meridianum]|uniref:Molybdate/tungstate import ATP-binding protein WtpC n=1 Tax=Oxyplasma meridianum TaxID=3073602 RepID=A0AAX4NHP6_9ARCH